MNGREDYVVDPAGTVNLEFGPDGTVFSTGFPPIEYTIWYMASLNQKDGDFNTPIDSFKKVDGYSNKVDESTIACYSLTDADGSDL